MNRFRTVAAVAAFTAAVVLLSLPARSSPGADRDSDSDEQRHDSRIAQGFAIAPVPLNILHERDKRQIGLGSYLVNAVGSCNDCHTFPNYAPGGNPFLGQKEQINTAVYLAGGRPFLTPTNQLIAVSRNITPDAQGRPAGLELDEFLSLMRTGIDPDRPGHLLQVMPWPVFGKMTDDDLRAIYEYLQAIPSLPDNSPPTH